MEGPSAQTGGPSPDGRSKVQARGLAQMEGTSTDGKSQLKQETLRPDGKLLRQLEGTSAQTGGNQRNRRPQPRREASAHTGSISPDRRKIFQIGGHSAQKQSPRPGRKPSPSGRTLHPDGTPRPRKKAPQAQIRGPSVRSGWNLFAQTGRPNPDRRLPAHTGGPSQMGGISPNGRPSARTGDLQPRREVPSPDGSPQPKRNPDGRPQPKWELPPPRPGPSAQREPASLNVSRITNVSETKNVETRKCMGEIMQISYRYRLADWRILTCNTPLYAHKRRQDEGTGSASIDAKPGRPDGFQGV